MTNDARPTITNARGSQLPNPAALGFEWKPVQKLLEQHGELRERGRENGRERRELQEHIRQLEREHARARAEAMRHGKEEPGRDEIEKAQKRYEALGQREKDIRQAAALVDADLYRVVAEHRDAWDAEIKREAAEVLEEAREVADELREKLYRADVLAAVHEWLERGGEQFALGPVGPVPVEGLIEQRRRAVGLIRSEAISTGAGAAS